MSEPVVLVGESLRRYTLEPAPLARGGQATVWCAVADDGQSVAIKVADPTRGSMEALEREATLLQWLAHHQLDGVMPILDRLSWEDRPAFVMPRFHRDAGAYVDRLKAERSREALEEILAFTAQICRALAGLHRAEVQLEEAGAGTLVHRDVKPENILVDAEGRPFLADLGGTLVVDALKAVRLAVFGSPLWAPYDQVLPGEPEPNPTWDSYAACVMLFWWLTGARPAYQADPSPMLTEQGRAIWEGLCAVARAQAEDREALIAAHRAFQAAREATREADLVEVRGHAAIQPEDLAALEQGVAALGDQERHGEEALRLCARDLGELLARGLSPLSHPSPPNRFWDCARLADELDAVRLRLSRAREARLAERDRAGLEARVAAMQGRVLPPTAVPIDAGHASEPGLDPLPARLRRPPPAAPAAPRIWLGLLVGALLLGLASLPLIYGVTRWVSARDEGSVALPGGTFPFGDTFGDGEEDERPVRQVNVAALRMDRTAVSVAEWRLCMNNGGCAPLAWMDLASPYHLGTGAKGEEFRGLTDENQPAVGATWYQAGAYCAWKKGRLPSEEEWEFAATWSPGAAQEADKRRWPWGDAAPDCEHANSADCRFQTTLPVDALPDGANAWGVLQLIGNVWQWTSSDYPVTRNSRGLFKKRDPKVDLHYVLRGGAWSSTERYLRPTFRRHAAPETISPLHGLRCVYD